MRTRYGLPMTEGAIAKLDGILDAIGKALVVSATEEAYKRGWGSVAAGDIDSAMTKWEQGDRIPVKW